MVQVAKIADASIIFDLLFVANAYFLIRSKLRGRESDTARLWFDTRSRLASIDAKNILLTRITLFVSALGFLHQITYRMNFQLQGLPH